MVRVWDIDIDKGIALTKFRIAHHEKHGVGLEVIKDKARLLKQQNHKNARKNNR